MPFTSKYLKQNYTKTKIPHILIITPIKDTLIHMAKNTHGKKKNVG